MTHVSTVRDTILTTTPRLALRRFRRDDAPALYSLNSNPEVIRYTGDESFKNPAAAADFIDGYDHYERHGYGRWAVVTRKDDRFIGFCGLRKEDSSGEVDLGFRFFREFWSKGYATESGRAALGLGFGRFKLNRIIGKSLRENLPSISVLQKLGMEFSDVREEQGMMWLIYAIDREDWDRREW